MMDPYRRQNYDSGSDYVLEYGELRFTFNERDFCERVEQAAMKLGFIERRLAFEESIRLPLLVRYPPKVRAAMPSARSGRSGAATSHG